MGLLCKQKFFLITFTSIVLTSCGGGGGGDSDNGDPQCHDNDPYCTSKYSKLRIKTPNGQIWLSLFGEYKTLQASTQGILKGETEFSDFTSKDLEYWTSTDTSVFTVNQDGLITAVGIGEAELIYELQIPGDIRQPARKRIVVKETDDNITPTIVLESSEITATGGDTVSLSGLDSFDTDGVITQHEWLLHSGPMAITIIDNNKSTASFIAPESKYTNEFVLRLTVTDNDGGTETETVKVTVNPSIANIPPKAQADNVEYHQLTKVVLDGSKSSDEDDGTENLSYFWEQTDTENSVVINNASSAVANFTAPETNQELTLHFTLTVTDPEGAKDSTNIVATIQPPEANLPPVANPEFISIDNSSISEVAKNAVSDDGRTTSIKVNEQTSVCIEGNKSSDPEDASNITYLWDDPAQDIEGVNQTNRSENQLCFNTPTLTKEKDIELTLTVTDTETATGKSSIFLKVIPVNATPKVKAEHTISNRTVTLADISEDDGAIKSCEWRQNQDDTVKIIITNSDKCEATFPEPITKEGTTLSFYLTVTDDEGMTVTNEEPYIVSIKPVDLTPQNLKIEHTYEGESVSSNLIWDDVTHNLNLNQTNYTIYRSKLPGVKTLPGNIFDSTYGESKGLENQTADAYYYVVTATYPDGTESELSNEAVYLPATAKLYLTEDIQEITLNWDSVVGADSYLVSWSEEGGLTQNEVVATNSYTDSDTTAGSKYNYRVTPIKNISGVQNRGVRSIEKSFYARKGEWEFVSEYLGTAGTKSGTSMTYNGDTILYYNGFDTDRLVSYNIDTNKWKIGESMANVVQRFVNHQEINPIEYDNKIYLFGDDTENSNMIMMVYDPFAENGQHWEEVVTPLQQIGSHAMVTENDGIAYIVGRYDEESSGHSAIMESINLNNYSETHTLSNIPIDNDHTNWFVDITAMNDTIYLLNVVRNYNDLEMHLPVMLPYSINDTEWKDVSEYDSPSALSNDDYYFNFSDSSIIAIPNEANPEESYIAIRAKYYNDLALFEYIPNLDTYRWKEKALSGETKFRYASDSFYYKGDIITMGGHEDTNRFKFNNSYELLSNVGAGYVSYEIELRPSAKVAHKSISVNNNVYTIGGYNDVFVSNLSMEIFDPKTDSFSIMSQMTPAEKVGHTLELVDDKIYVLGYQPAGLYVAPNVPEPMKIDVFDTASNEWSQGGEIPDYRQGTCTATVDDKIFVIGGVNSEGDLHDDILVYSPTSESCQADPSISDNCWQKLDSEETILPTKRTMASCVAIGSNIYIAGGQNNGVSINTIEIFDTSTMQWKNETVDIPEAFNDEQNSADIHRLLSINEKLFVMGIRGTVMEYNIYTKKWIEVPKAPLIISTVETTYFSLFMDNGKIYKYGGNFGIAGNTGAMQVYK